MPFLYVTEQGAVLRKAGDRLIVKKGGDVLLDVPCHKIEGILLFGSVQVTTQALSELLEQGIELALLTRRGRLKGQLTPVKPKNITLRVAQFERSRDPAFSLSVAKALVEAKIRNGLTVMRRFTYNHPEKREVIAGSLRELERTIADVQNADALPSLSGSEGTAARHYFGAFGELLLNGMVFPGRRRRPAPDPVNALLSFGYTLIANELHSLLDAIGFDPYLGFYHQVHYGRPSLALDLVEEFRHPLVDRFTLQLLNKRVLTEDDFYLDEASGSMYLKLESMKTYFRHFERWMEQGREEGATGKLSYRQLFRDQAYRMAEAIKTGTAYVPYRYAE